MVRLGINIDHSATVRQARKESFPDPVLFALEAVKAGAAGVTAHLREDRRHIQDDDIVRLKNELSVPLNLEMAASEDILRVAETVVPAWTCLVPEKREELTTEGGLNLASPSSLLKETVKRLKGKGVKVSFFIEPDKDFVKAAKDLGGDAVEFHTGPYSRAFALTKKEENCSGENLAASSAAHHEIKRILSAAKEADGLGLLVNAGHGLDYDNTGPLASAYPFNEFNIGFSIVARSLFVGVGAAVAEMKKIMETKVCVES